MKNIARFSLIATLVASALACGGGSTPTAPTAPAAPAAPAPAAPASPAAPVAPILPASAPPTTAPGGYIPPNLGACNDITLLTQYKFEDLAAGKFCEVCKGKDDRACVMDWPFNDVPSCDSYDALRNGVYAYYGRPFETAKWKEYFAKQSWYKADPTYTDARLTPTAMHNVEVLKQKAAKKEGCM